MASLNHVQIIGYLGNDPELRNMPNGDAVANISVATSERWTDKNSGQLQERTEWHRVSLFRRQAEVAGQYLKKGSLVYIQGRLQTRSWEQDGVKRYTTEIMADVMTMLDRQQNGATGGNGEANRGIIAYGPGGSGGRHSSRPATGGGNAAPNNHGAGGSGIDYDDDIPF